MPLASRMVRPHNVVWVAASNSGSSSGQTIFELTSGTSMKVLHPFPIPAALQCLGACGSLVVGTDGALWFLTGISSTTGFGATIELMTASGTFSKFSLPHGDTIRNHRWGDDAIWSTT